MTTPDPAAIDLNMLLAKLPHDDAVAALVAVEVLRERVAELEGDVSSLDWAAERVKAAEQETEAVEARVVECNKETWGMQNKFMEALDRAMSAEDIIRQWKDSPLELWRARAEAAAARVVELEGALEIFRDQWCCEHCPIDNKAISLGHLNECRAVTDILAATPERTAFLGDAGLNTKED